MKDSLWLKRLLLCQTWYVFSRNLRAWKNDPPSHTWEDYKEFAAIILHGDISKLAHYQHGSYVMWFLIVEAESEWKSMIAGCVVWGQYSNLVLIKKKRGILHSLISLLPWIWWTRSDLHWRCNYHWCWSKSRSRSYSVLYSMEKDFRDKSEEQQ